MSRERLKVHELIALLAKMPPEAEVYTEGCDCYGDARGVVIQEDGVVISRDTTVSDSLCSR